MRSTRVLTFILAASVAALGFAEVSNADIIAGWAQNNNADANAGDGFALSPDDFPQANDTGPASAAHTINPINAAVDGFNNYIAVDSFAGTTNNDLASLGAGGSFSFIGTASNGSQSIFAVPTTGYEDILVSWSQRGTSTGFNSRVFEYSSDGGANWTDIGAYAGSAGALSSTFTTVSLDLSAITAIDNNASAMFRITYDGASSSSGNNRWDNFYVQGTVVPEPSTFLLLGMAAIGLVAFARRK